MTFRRAAIVAAIALGILPAAANAQPAGWSQVRHFTVTEGSGATLTAYQVRVVLDTATPIAAGQMRADAGDLRFGPDLAGSSFYPYWIESGIDTASTVVWVAVPSLPASTASTVYVYFGNASATPVSALSVFDGPRSATNQVSGANTGGVTNSQRGFRFTSSVPILVTQFGKNEPNGSTRYVTLFDGSSQAVLQQIQVSGPAAQYSYASLPAPVWLDAGHDGCDRLASGSCLFRSRIGWFGNLRGFGGRVSRGGRRSSCRRRGGRWSWGGRNQSRRSGSRRLRRHLSRWGRRDRSR